MLKKIVAFSLLPIVGFSSIFLTSCFGLPSKNIFIDPENGIDKKYLVSAKQLEYISQRTFSLEFDTISMSNGGEYKINGTGWIMAKQPNTENYFIATNIHVASVVQNQGKTWQYVENNQVKTSVGNTIIQSKLGFITPTINNFETDRSNDISPVRNYVNVSTPKIVYDATEGWSNVRYNESNSQSFIVKNPTSDFAVLEYNFDNIENNSPLKNFLKYFDNNPTKFANTYVTSDYSKDTNVYFMGGFPIKEMSQGDSESCWIGLSDLKSSSYFYNGNFISQSDDPSGAAPQNSLQYYKSDSQKWFWNISKDLTFIYASMGGGSSGSMVINQNDEVVGIYWGEIDFSNNESYAPVDLLRSSSFTFEDDNNVSQTFPSIDLIDGFVQKMHSKNITLNNEINNI